jgi:hypothetical protein
MTREQEYAAMVRMMSVDQRYEVISRYGRLLEKTPSPVGREADLPYPKAVIRKAIYEELWENPDSEQRNFLEIAFVQLECFLPPDEFKVVYDFKRASTRAQELAGSGKAKDIVASAGILNQVEGEKAVRILEGMSRNMRRRILEIRAIMLPAFNSRVC